MNRIYNGPCNGDGHGNGYDHDCCGSTAIWWLRPRQRLRPRLLRLNDDGDYDVDDGDDCGNLVASTTIAATWWLRPRQRLRPRLLQLNGGHYDVGDGDDCGGHGHDC